MISEEPALRGRQADECDAAQIGSSMYELIAELYPICRSITGNGFRQTMRILQRHVPLELHEVPSGTQVFDWTVPREWNIRDAYIQDTTGRRVVDFRHSNLHVVSYSAPIRRRVRLEELKQHVFTLPHRPEWIPYRTSYFHETWGFCLSHRQLESLQDEEYDVCIDSSLTDGSLTYGEYYLPGRVPDEVLIVCHACHPSLCNDNLSGVSLVAHLARWLGSRERRYSYRFLFVPGTIGSITWLCLNESRVSRIQHGLIAVCVGDSGRCTYKKSRRGNAEVDRAAAHVLQHSGADYEMIDFFPYGYDERQYCSPGFNLPMGCLMRTPHGQFPEYHTSADNLELVQPAFLADSFSKFQSVIEVLDANRTYVNLNPKCEPQLGKRGLYGSTGGAATMPDFQFALLWVLNLSDGQHTLLDIAERAGLKFETIKSAADALARQDLLAEAPAPGPGAEESQPAAERTSARSRALSS